MYDIQDILNTVERVYDTKSNFQILKDFERVLDELDLYVYSNWIDGELVKGPIVERHWVTCQFMWPYTDMPDPSGGKRLTDYNCKVKYIKTHVVEPRMIKTPADIRPGTRKGKLDSKPVWVVEIAMPKKLISDIWVGYQEKFYSDNDVVAQQVNAPTDHQGESAGMDQPMTDGEDMSMANTSGGI